MTYLSLRIPRKTLHRNEGFTLIEMLVVLAIFALLISLIVPAINRVQRTAKQTACAGNLRQCGQALLAYATEHQGNLPNPGKDYNLDRYAVEFIEALKPYVGDYMIWGCPASGVVPMDHPENTVSAPRGGYFYYPYRFPNAQNYTTLRSNFPLMQDTLYTWEGDWRSNHSIRGKLRVDAVAGSPSFRTYFGGRPDGMNLLVLDGSVQWYKWKRDMEGFAWILNVSGNRTASTEAVLKSIQDL
ncbi:type II secretion system protein [Kiritimatiellaeota bacterium B1221]|nr:type II secretion system protein [Kiritimatiellaeota bacterium B1221]